MKKYNLILSLVFFILFHNNSISQETKHNELVVHKNEHFKKHAISFVISHTHLKTGVKDNSGNSFLALPSLAFNYNYNFNEKWALGLHNDIIIEEFVVSSSDSHQSKAALKSENNEDQTIDRGKPVSTAIMLTYKPFKHLALLAGGGM